MEPKSSKKDSLSYSRKSYSIPSQGTNNLYRKRLRSWKRSPTPIPSALTDSETISTQKSTIYTFPLRPNGTDQQSENSNAVLTESFTSEQTAFYASTIPHPSGRLGDDLNNNHMASFNEVDTKRETKRKIGRSNSTESSASQSLEIITHPISNESLQLICEFDSSNCETNVSNTLADPRAPVKRSRISSSVESDPCTIDINQCDLEESSSFSLEEKLPLNNSTAIVNAVKIVQPIVDIIFNAFENQLKGNEIRTLQPAISYPIYSPLMMSCAPARSLARPITLHAVHFNIQLTTEQPSKPSIVDVTSSSPPSTSDPPTTTEETLISGHRLKQMIQLALVGVSVLCGYWFL